MTGRCYVAELSERFPELRPVCGGLRGISGHHGQFDGGQFKLSREMLPPETEEFAADLGLDWWLDRQYGPRADG
jgi:hypothetical protein